MTYEKVALQLDISPQELERESLRVFLTQRLRRVESQLLDLSRRYGVRTVAALDALIQAGELHEAETFEDFFEFDALEAERNTLLNALQELA